MALPAEHTSPKGTGASGPRLAVIGASSGAYTRRAVSDEPDPIADPVAGEAHATTVAGTADATRRSTVGAGSVLAERYRLVRRIGGGGMGSVWESEHLVLGSRVAIKLISAALVDDERARSRFLREAQAAAALRSPHVVHIFDHGVHENTPYIAMELLDGEPLSTRLAARGRLPADEVLALMIQVGRATTKAHEAGVVHRDLKPDNIYLTPGEHGDLAKVLDFGIAKRSAELALGATTSSGALLGTPFYMSPEQLIDATLADARSDLWSLAVITYECLLGRRPFAGDSMAELAVAVLAEPVPIPSRHGVVPIGFDGWFARATQREPDARFQGAAEMTAALAQCLRDQGPVEVATRRPALVLAVAATVAGALGLAALALWDDPPPPRDATAQPELAPIRGSLDTPPPRASTIAPDEPQLATPDDRAALVPAGEPATPDGPATAGNPDEPRRRPVVKSARKPPWAVPSEEVPPPRHDTSELEP
jgi:serine/threonine protein kinase